MGLASLCVLMLCLLNPLIHCEQAEADKTKPDLTVSPLWPSPGDSVTLSCSVGGPSAGWRFYWYEAAAKRSNGSRSYELLPGSGKGTEEGSFIVRGQTHTAGYKCRARREGLGYYTDYSQPKFVWFGDSHSASVRVTPDRAQHFSSKPVSLSCEGNSTEWTVRRYSEAGHLSNCSTWGAMSGSTCSLHMHKNKTTVYWCETASGEFSNAVNITVQYKDIILESPVHPVTEGNSVTLVCKLRNGTFISNVFFYRNGDLIQSDRGGELQISAVSKSDEGFYKCEHSGSESLQSWVAVKMSGQESSSFPLPLIIGLICGLLLIILLLLLCCCMKSKDSFFARTLDQGAHQSDTRPKVHSSHLRDAVESSDITYSLLQLQNMQNKGRHHVLGEHSVYSNVKTGSAAGTATHKSPSHILYFKMTLQVISGRYHTPPPGVDRAGDCLMQCQCSSF
ncbi:low affinity immunoglobulin gamma Fc region receptor II-b-like isoform X2 [Chelmon rostratus]|uniref:low affinity immunoglobulin gamma Fc region receptor II-b-like isoform X2 n=1 Tax=Chelmon rostratus TaxID=109905 RepID=UPI001BEC00C6|nr:low affinity immunoglobulin gamma Fc region receptor II-b-like isoform X2 [Chelmon rostratus]